MEFISTPCYGVNCNHVTCTMVHKIELKRGISGQGDDAIGLSEAGLESNRRGSDEIIFCFKQRVCQQSTPNKKIKGAPFTQEVLKNKRAPLN